MTFLTVVIILAIVRAALVALVVALGIVLLVSFVTRPRETLAFIVTATLTGLASARPVSFIIAVGIIALAVVAADACRKRRWKSLTDARDRRTHGVGRLNRDLLG